ncbi:MAG: DeoR/GlpR transcriptional regulator [Erysipelotrichaceae bacterium]|nr:DeoR/GlpR transcriptional regulator [Erysipelotrichaceae bacterium]
MTEIKGKHKYWKQILDLCENRESISVNEILEKIEISGSTLRRELRKMEDAGLISRYYGGLTLAKKEQEETSYLRKTLENEDIKRRLCRFAASLIKDHQMVYIDAGSTLRNIAEYITARNVTVVTPSISLIEPLSRRNIQCFFLGGFVKQNTYVTVGNATVSMIKSFYYNIAFIGTNGIHQKAGFTTTEDQEANMKAAAIAQAEKSYIVTDHTKFNKILMVRFADLKDATVITDSIDGFDGSLIDYKIV